MWGTTGLPYPVWGQEFCADKATGFQLTACWNDGEMYVINCHVIPAKAGIQRLFNVRLSANYVQVNRSNAHAALTGSLQVGTVAQQHQ